MKSKIEKLVKQISWDYANEKVVGKINEIIDHLNSQDQEENEPEKVYVDPIVPDFIAEKLAEERYNTREILLNGTKPLEVEDTSEEWVKEFKFSYGHLYIQNEDGEFCKINGEVEDMIDFIRQLLEERVENVLEQIQDWLRSDKGGDMDDEYLNILIDDIEELKPNTKKK